MKSHKKKVQGHVCYDCGEEMIGRGVTMGRVSCPTIWVSICMDCFEKQPMTQKAKKEWLKKDMLWKEFADRLIIDK